MLLQHATDMSLLKMFCHQVDTDPSTALQLRQLLQYLLQQRFGNGNDQATGFGMLDKGGRGNKLLALLPAHQDFITDNFALINIDYGLIERDKLLPGNSPLDHTLERTVVAQIEPISPGEQHSE